MSYSHVARAPLASAAGDHFGPPLGTQKPLKIECFFMKVLGSIWAAKMLQKWSQNATFWRLLGVLGSSIDFGAFLSTFFTQNRAFWDLGPSKMSFPSRRRAKIHIFARFTLFSENVRKSHQNSPFCVNFDLKSGPKRLKKGIQKTARFQTPF